MVVTCVRAPVNKNGHDMDANTILSTEALTVVVMIKTHNMYYFSSDMLAILWVGNPLHHHHHHMRRLG